MHIVHDIYRHRFRGLKCPGRTKDVHYAVFHIARKICIIFIFVTFFNPRQLQPLAEVYYISCMYLISYDNPRYWIA